jgi:hypothetical protein
MIENDALIPVVFGPRSRAGNGDAVLVEASGAAAPLQCDPGSTMTFSVARQGGHPAACACCTPRGAVAEALGRLFLARVRGEIPFFRRVVAITSTEAGAAAVRAAGANDPLTAARYRLA